MTAAARVAETWWQHLSPDLRHFYGDAPNHELPVTPYMALDERWAGSDWQYLRAEVSPAPLLYFSTSHSQLPVVAPPLLNPSLLVLSFPMR